MRLDFEGGQLRKLDLRDVVCLAEKIGDPDVRRSMSSAVPDPYTESDAQAWVEMATQDEPLKHFAIALESGELVGGIGLFCGTGDHTRTAEIGYWIAQSHWGGGLATRAVQALVPYAFETFPEIERLEARVYDNNPASARVLEKSGFSLEGRLRKHVFRHGKILDDLVYSRLRGE